MSQTKVIQSNQSHLLSRILHEAIIHNTKRCIWNKAFLLVHNDSMGVKFTVKPVIHIPFHTCQYTVRKNNNKAKIRTEDHSGLLRLSNRIYLIQFFK